MNFYNEIDPKAAQWIRELIARGIIPNGVVDERSITEIQPEDLHGFVQCHFFCGIAGWPLALALAGWPATRPVWTGSCPCQPFSCAGKQGGKSDERHLWPEFFRLIAACRPQVIFGEQVASAAGREWFSGNADVQRMLDRETVERVLSDCPLGRVPDDLQRMLARSREDAGRIASGREEGNGEGIPEEISGEGASEDSEATGTIKRSGLLLGGAPYSRCDRCGRLRVDGDTVQLGRREDLGQSLFGQDQQLEGLHSRQCACGAVLRERDGQRVGVREDHRNGRRHHRAQDVAISDLPTQAECETQGVDGPELLSGVRADLEGTGYACGAANLPAGGVGSPHRRERLFFVAHATDRGFGIQSNGARGRGESRGGSSANGRETMVNPEDVGCEHGERSGRSEGGGETTRRRDGEAGTGRSSGADPVDDAGGERGEQREHHRSAQSGGDGKDNGVSGSAGDRCGAVDNTISNGRRPSWDDHREDERVVADAAGNPRAVANIERERLEGLGGDEREGAQPGREREDAVGSIAAGGSTRPWERYEIIACRDGKARRIESGTFPLVNGIPRGVVPSCDISVPYAKTTAEGRIMRLRGYGNAIVPQVAAIFIRAAEEAQADVLTSRTKAQS